MIFARFDCKDAEGVILAHTLRLSHRIIKKGKSLTPDDLADIQRAGLDDVTGVRLEQGDASENRAAIAVATALAGSNLTIGKPLGGRVKLYARQQGVVVIDRARIDAINMTGGSIAVATLPEYAEAMADQAVASIKVIPFAVSQDLVDQCVDLALRPDTENSDNPAVSFKPYRPKRAALILTETPGLKASILDSTGEVTQARLQSMGSQLVFEQRCSHSIKSIRKALKLALASDCELILICGATVTVDVNDVVPSAIVQVGGDIDHFGMPVEPGNMLLLAHHGSHTVINLPGCSRSPKLNGLDWVLQRTLADIPIGRRDILSMGVGGLIKDTPHVKRIRKYRRQMQVAGNIALQPQTPRVAAIILAAGSSRRMGEQNKLLASVGTEPMVRHVVSAALNSVAEKVIVVTGHEMEAVQQALAGQDVVTVFNPDYASGITSSIRSGLGAVADDIDGAIILLGDMPFVSTEQIDELIAEFNPNIERDIVVPFRDGHRGNPILWARRYFAALMALTGDTGGSRLLKENAGNIWDVPISDEAIFVDIDTPEALAEADKNQVKDS